MRIEITPQSLLFYSLSIAVIIISITFAFSKYTLYMEFELNKRQHALDVLQEVTRCFQDLSNEEVAKSCAERAKGTLLDKKSVWRSTE